MLNPKIADKTIDLSLIFGFFITPLLFFTQTHDQFELPKVTFLILLALPLLLLELKEKNNTRIQPLALFLLVFLFIQGIACLPGISLSWVTSLWGDYENFAGFSTLVTYVTWYFLLSRHLNTKRVEKVFYFVSLSAFFSSLYAIGQHFQFDFIQWNPDSISATREFAAMGNPNFLSAYIAMSLPLFLTLSFRPQEDKTQTQPIFSPIFSLFLILGAVFLFFGTAKGQLLLRLEPSSNFSFITRTLGLLSLSLFCVNASRFQHLPIKIFVTIILVLGLLSTASRGGFLGAIIGAGTWLFLAFQNQEWKETIRQRWTMVSKLQLSIISAMLSVFILFFGWSFIQRLLDSVIHASQSLATSRLHIWGPALTMIKANPIFGTGLDTFKIAFPFYSGIEFNQIDGLFTSSRMAHNELLQIASTSGLLGLASYLLLLIAFVFYWRKAYQNSNASERWYLIAVLSSALAYQIQNFFSFGVAAINLLWFFLLASLSYFNKTENAAPSTRLFFYFQKLIIISFIALIASYPIRRLAADIAYGQGDIYSNAIKTHDAHTSADALNYYSNTEIHYLNRAADLFPWDVKYTLYQGLAYEQRGRLDSSQAKEYFPKALYCYQKAVQMSPANAYYHNDEGRIYSSLSIIDPQYLEKSEQAYGKAVYYSPASPYFILNWVTSLEKVGKTEEANQQTAKAFTIDAAFTSKILAQMAFERYQAGDKITAFRYVNEAAGNTASPEAFYCRGLIYLSEKNKKKALADFIYTQNLHPDPYKNSSVQHLDDLIQECQK
ncbi:MAG TPA: O-antigen ligase family protein [bacterium]|nr:O-antigen ligase family protein [bacterium]